MFSLYHFALYTCIFIYCIYSWSSSQSLDISQSVSYGIGLIEGETAISFTAEWGQEHTQTSESSVALEQGVDVTLDPSNSFIFSTLFLFINMNKQMRK